MKNIILSNISETFWSTDIEAQQQIINELDSFVPKTAHLANPTAEEIPAEKPPLKAMKQWSEASSVPSSDGFTEDDFVVWDYDTQDWAVAEDEDPREWSVRLSSLDEMVDTVKKVAPIVMGIAAADAMRRAQPGYQLRHAIQLSPAEELVRLQKLQYLNRIGNDFKLSPPDQISFDKWLQDYFQRPAGGSGNVGLLDEPIDPITKASSKLKSIYDEIKVMTPDQVKKHMRLHTRGTARAEWASHLGEPLTEEIIRSTWDNPKEGVKWWREEIIKAEKIARAKQHRMNEIRKMLGKPPIKMQSDSFFHSDVIGEADWQKIQTRINTTGKMVQEQFPKITTQKIKTTAAKTGGVLALILSLIALVRTYEDPDVTQSGGSIGKAITEGWQGPWFKEYMKGLGHFVSGGDEGAKSWTVEHFIYLLSSHPRFGWDNEAKKQLMKEIPKSLKDLAMGAIVEPLMWLAESIDTNMDLHPMNAIRGQSTPMGQYPPSRWQ